MKKKFALLLLCIAILSLLPAAALADVGPKPSVRISFENMGDEPCFGTLLSKASSTGPYSAANQSPPYREEDADPSVYDAFVHYQDPDGYYYLQTEWPCGETMSLDWTYYPPQSFKLLLYYPDSGQFVSSGIYERYAFDSYYKVDMTAPDGGDTLLLVRSYDYTWETISLICRIVITILLELGVALLFNFREKKVLRIVLIVNVLTQVVLNLLLNYFNYIWGYLSFMFLYVLLELLVFLIEAVVYSVLLPRSSSRQIPRWLCVLYALAANALSFLGGGLLARFIPGIF